MATKYRKKPVVIEAVQYRDAMRVADCLPQGVHIVPTPDGDKPAVHTIHNGQTVIIEDGDWVIPEPDGTHFYPCKPDIFAATYEPVEGVESDQISPEKAAEIEFTAGANLAREHKPLPNLATKAARAGFASVV